jgi:hypothetical protein
MEFFIFGEKREEIEKRFFVLTRTKCEWHKKE